MNRRILLPLVITVVVGLALGSWWFAMAADAPEPTSYRLETGRLMVQGAASGGDYRLLVPEGRMGRGTQCCCTYLPCMWR